MRMLAALAALAVLTYLPVFVQPFVSDDYIQIHLARKYGPASGWAELAADPLYRCRSTSLLMTCFTDRLLGLTPRGFYSTSVLLHVLNTWLVLALGVWRLIGWRTSAAAAAFFAVHEGHQEAVMWYAALPELLLFFGALLCLVCWIRWVQSGGTARRWYAGALLAYLCALASKESAVAVVPLLALPLSGERIGWRRGMSWLAPFGAVALPYAWLIFVSQRAHVHFSDGSFSLDAPFWVAWSNSFGRVLWIWGLIGLLALGAWRARRWLPAVSVALVWIGITLLPYSFLTYMPRVPSRHTYWASAGLALLVAAAFLECRERLGRRSVAAAVGAVILAHNAGYIWIKKRAQFLERAAPTEALVKLARRSDGPIYVHCFPYGFEVAQRAVELATGKPASVLIWDRSLPRAAVFCPGGHVFPATPSGATP